MKKLPELNTERTHLRLLSQERAVLAARYYEENKEHLAPWEPERLPEFFTPGYWDEQIAENLKAFEEKTDIRLFALDLQDSEILGVCNFTNISFGPFMACHLGYSISRRFEGKGLMSEILEAGIKFMFETIGLHRIMANYQPHNYRSAALLDRLGFIREGYAQSYLKLNGAWRDHVLTSRINHNADEA